MELKKIGRRHYAMNAPFELKEKLKEMGCTFDWDRKAWWTGKAEVAEKIRLMALQAASGDGGGTQRPAETISLDAHAIRGRATYKGASYFVLYHNDGQGGAKRATKLCSRDGQRVFWAGDMTQLVIEKLYAKPRSIAGIRAYAEQAKTFGGPNCACNCHHEPDAGKPGSILYDGCERCGCEAC